MLRASPAAFLTIPRTFHKVTPQLRKMVASVSLQASLYLTAPTNMQAAFTCGQTTSRTIIDGGISPRQCRPSNRQIARMPFPVQLPAGVAGAISPAGQIRPDLLHFLQ
jgi:hypothetical protein